jgi:hypothetical protein
MSYNLFNNFKYSLNTHQGSFYNSRYLVLLKDLHNQINISTVNILYFHIEPMFLIKIKIMLINYQLYSSIVIGKNSKQKKNGYNFQDKMTQN